MKDFPGEWLGYGEGEGQNQLAVIEVNQAQASEEEVKNFCRMHFVKEDFEKATAVIPQICTVWKSFSDNGEVFELACRTHNVKLKGKRRRKVLMKMILLLAARKDSLNAVA